VSGLDLPGVEHAPDSSHRRLRALGGHAHRARTGTPGLSARCGGAGRAASSWPSRSASVSARGIAGASVLLLEAGPRVLAGLPGFGRRAGSIVTRTRGIVVRCGVRVAEAHADRLMLESGETLPRDVFAWVAGRRACRSSTARASSGMRGGSSRCRDATGGGTRRDLATDDCASFATALRSRQGGRVRGARGAGARAQSESASHRRLLKPYRPQRDFLSLLNLGDGRAVASKWGPPPRARGRGGGDRKDRRRRQTPPPRGLLPLRGAPLPLRRGRYR
jgi:hypothetical protein